MNPWEQIVDKLRIAFTGPMAEAFTILAIVIGGLMWMYGEHGAKKQLAGVLFGGGLVMFATQVFTWLF
jgi:type IV secretory pathway VirB2 component (pilin)